MELFGSPLHVVLHLCSKMKVVIEDTLSRLVSFSYKYPK